MNKRYFSYLLRLWRSDAPESPAWRASLEDPSTRQVISFCSQEKLVEFLLELMTSHERDNAASNQSTSPIRNPVHEDPESR
jgi:hypothetical protein